MSKLISVRAYEYKELNDEAKATFIHYMYDSPFDYEDEDEEGNTVIKYNYFADMNLEEQIEFCEMIKQLVNMIGNLTLKNILNQDLLAFMKVFGYIVVLVLMLSLIHI